jgi:hypothetical protein
MLRQASTHDLQRATQRLDDLAMTSETAANKYRREAEECRRNAESALRRIDQEAWLRLAADWAKLAEGAEPDRRLGDSA